MSQVAIPDQWGCSEFLEGYPEMVLEEVGSDGARFSGWFRFSASRPGESTRIQDQFQIAIQVPRIYPCELPVVFETGGRIPRLPEFHVNSNGSLCLGSPIRLLLIVSRHRTILDFVDRALVPYLFAVSTSLVLGRSFPFGELPHGAPGALADYQELWGLKSGLQAKLALHSLTLKRRVANKRPCPCGCGLRLGKCSLHLKLGLLRNGASRSWFRRELARHQ